MRGGIAFEQIVRVGLTFGQSSMAFGQGSSRFEQDELVKESCTLVLLFCRLPLKRDVLGFGLNESNVWSVQPLWHILVLEFEQSDSTL